MLTGDLKILVQKDNLIVEGEVTSLYGKTPGPILMIKWWHPYEVKLLAFNDSVKLDLRFQVSNVGLHLGKRITHVREKWSHFKRELITLNSLENLTERGEFKWWNEHNH